MSALKVSRLDSPLTRSTDPESNPQDDQPSAPSTVSSPARRRRRPTPAAAGGSAPSTQPGAEAAPEAAPSRVLAGAGERLEPPALDETLELLSARVPASLRRNLAEMTAALRARQGGRVSQKRLPEQELLAVALWMVGSARDPAHVEAFAQAHDAYRARQHAAAAVALAGPSVSPAQ